MQRMRRRDFLVVAAAMGCSTRKVLGLQEKRIQDVLPFDFSSADRELGTKRRIFAHWHIFPTSFDNKPSSIDTYAGFLSADGEAGNYKGLGGYIRERPIARPPRSATDWAIQDMMDEVRSASAIGLDGFQYNIITVSRKHRFWVNLEEMLEACRRTGLNYSIMLSLDCATKMIETPVWDIANALAGLAKHPSVARHQDGRLLLGAFAAEKWPHARWQELLDSLKARGHTPYFIPHFLDLSRGLQYLTLVDGASIWGGNHLSQLPTIRTFARVVRSFGKDWIATVWPQDFRPKNRWFAEAENSRLFREGWHEAITAEADGVSIATWNDYSEHSEIRPSTGIQYSYYDLTAYYGRWFKTGDAPRIIRDVLYYFHRIEAPDAVGTGSSQATRFFNRFRDPMRNEIELLAFLTHAGKINIVTSAGTVSMNAPEGISSLRAPLVKGRPTFQLVRNGNLEISFESAFQIRDSSKFQDLLYRGGSSTRAPIE
jgi:hypothetical protein